MRESTLDPRPFTNSLNSFPVPSSPGSKTRMGKGAAFTALRRLGPEQHVHGAGAAVDRARRNECHDIQVTAQPKVHRRFEYRAARARAISLAVDDSHAPVAAVAAACDEIGKPVARRRLT